MKRLIHFLRDKSGATALEFAILAVPLFMCLFAIIEISYKAMVQNELDSKLYIVSNDIAINNFTAGTAQEFMRDYFCPEIGTNFMKCENVEIGIRRVVNRPYTYRNSSSIGSWEMGNMGDTLLIELNYPVTNLVHPLAIADTVQRNNRAYYRARSVIRREPLF